MTRLLRVTCPTTADIPPAHQLRAWTTDARAIVLLLPTGTLAGAADTKASVVARLAATLPELRVSDGGADCAYELVTVVRLVG